MTRPEGAWREYGPLELTTILAAALEAFYEQGFHGTPVRDIARRVGQTVPALYYHHENKDGVVTALVEEATSDLDRRVRQAVEEAGDRPGRQLVNVVEAIVPHRGPANRTRYATRRTGIEVPVARIVEDGGPLSPEELAKRYVDIALMTVGVRRRPTARARRTRVRSA